ncbi:MAG: transcription termination/antitermination NusG family protein, partial [Deltaproteobacteria bacterium]|nr:transcription termination/antitermination NusG family protein [Deltaproteobacteria bacterium]
MGQASISSILFAYYSMIIQDTSTLIRIYDFNVPNELNDPNDPNVLNEIDQMNQINQTDGLTRYFGTFHWFVIQTKPGDEHRVETHLLNQKIEIFLPLLEIHQYSSGKMIQKIKPLFPSYIFARLDLKVHYYK